MSGFDGEGLCSYDELRDYLQMKGIDPLLSYVRERNGRYELAEEKYVDATKDGVRKYQIACVFMLLGEYTIAERIHRLGWPDLSAWGDKIGNDLLKHFMRPYPPPNPEH